jgi:hypothetical protein
VKSFFLGAATATERLRGRAGLGAPALAVAIVIGSAIVELRREPAAAADVTLAGAAFGVCLPLVAYAIVARATRHGRLDDGVRHLSRHGASRRSAVAGLVVRATLHVAAIGALLGLLAVIVARGRLDMATVSDALTTVWIGALGGAAYAAWLSLGSLFGRAGGGRLVCLGLDFTIGAGSSASASPWPRAHVRSLIGGACVLGIPAWESAVALLALAVVYLLLCLLRVAR